MHEATDSDRTDQVQILDIWAQKKPDASPCEYTRVRPRTRFQDDRETSSRNEGTMLLLVFRTWNQKNCCKLGRFSCTFDWNTVEMSLKPDSYWAGKRFQNTIYTLSEKKSNCFSAFFCEKTHFEGKKEGRLRVHALLGTATPPRWPRSRSATFLLKREMRNRIATTFNFVTTNKTKGIRIGRFAGGGFARRGKLAHARQHLYLTARRATELQLLSILLQQTKQKA